MNATPYLRDIFRRAVLVALALMLVLGFVLAATGCQSAEDALQEQQQEEAEQFEQDIENSAGGASDAEAAVDEMNEMIGQSEDAANQ